MTNSTQRIKSHLDPTGPRYGLPTNDVKLLLSAAESARALIEEISRKISTRAYDDECGLQEITGSTEMLNLEGFLEDLGFETRWTRARAAHKDAKPMS